MSARDRSLPAAWRGFLLGACAILSLAGLAAQDTASGSTSADDEALFGAETVTESKPSDVAPQAEFLKYDQVKVGGSLTGNLGYTATWIDPWNSTPNPIKPDSRALQPALTGTVKISAKPSADFGVNMDFRSTWPFFTTKSFLTSASYYADNTLTPVTVDPGITTKSDSLTTTNLNIWALYSKFSWRDALFFSFGKQPLAWGVSKSFFQPANDIFALAPVDFADTSAEREGPIVFKAQYPLPLELSSLYFYAGVPDGTSLDLGDARIALKAETSFLNTELAAGGFYSWNDHPRALLMGTTGTGDFNFFGEAVGKWGSERYFLEKAGPATVGAQKADQLWFSGTVGGYYTNTDNNIVVSLAYYYNGEGQTGVTAKEAYAYYYFKQSEIDRMKFGTHYAGFSFSKQKLLVDDLSFTVYGVGDLSDQSFLLAPSFTWLFFDYASAKLGAVLTFGPNGSEYTMMGGGKPSAAVNLTLTLGNGAF
ncbi:MAG: hypothetical protein WCL50_14180 [Spirochaetota bacterium]